MGESAFTLFEANIVADEAGFWRPRRVSAVRSGRWRQPIISGSLDLAHRDLGRPAASDGSGYAIGDKIGRRAGLRDAGS